MIRDINNWHPYLDFNGFYRDPPFDRMSWIRVFFFWLVCHFVKPWQSP